ncbi:hypothetical protein Droror1_Dr00016284 [Drosera rotundifolia]
MKILFEWASVLIQPLKLLVVVASLNPAGRWKSVFGNSEPLDDSTVLPYNSTWEQCGRLGLTPNRLISGSLLTGPFSSNYGILNANCLFNHLMQCSEDSAKSFAGKSSCRAQPPVGHTPPSGTHPRQAHTPAGNSLRQPHSLPVSGHQP